MSDFDVYESDMPNRSLTEQDVELVLGGEMPERADLARLVTILDRLHPSVKPNVSDQALVALSTRAAEVARAGGAQVRESTAPAWRGRSTTLLRTRWAVALGAAVLLTGMTGVAVAADASAPGEALYGLDRAMESIGVGDGGPPERIAEAKALFLKGEVTTALAQAVHAIEASDEASGGGQQTADAARAAEDLRSAAERVAGEDDVSTDSNVAASVEGILDEIATMLDSGDFQRSELGARISELARSLRRDGTGGPSDEDEPSAGPPGQENTPPGRPDHVGPPDDVGPPADPGGPGRP